MPFKGNCLFCNQDFEAETRDGFGDALIKHHNDKGCDVFLCFEFDGEKVIGSPFGLEVIKEGEKEIVSNSLTDELWYQKGRGTERGQNSLAPPDGGFQNLFLDTQCHTT